MSVALKSPTSLSFLGNKEEVMKFFSLCEGLLSDVKNKELITDRLYRRYIRYSDIMETQKIIKFLEERFNKLNLGYQSYFETFNDMFEEVDFLKNSNNFFGRVQLCIGEIPYSSVDLSKDDKFYDSLDDDSEPFWARDINNLRGK